MDERLQNLMERAETCLDAPSRATLAEIVDGFIATHTGPQDFTPQELAHLRRIDAEPFVPADAEKVAALFARRD
ncbi:MAG: hypothetical protein GW798_12185 [Roseovarius sp.]|nr:hypothetical protein [Roseovarius sp.]